MILMILHWPLLHCPIPLILLQTPRLQRPILLLLHMIRNPYLNILNLLLLQFLLPTPSPLLPVPNMNILLLARETRNVTQYATPTKQPRTNLLIASDINRDPLSMRDPPSKFSL